MFAISTPQFAIFDNLHHEVANVTSLSALCDKFAAKQQRGNWTIIDDLLLFTGRVFVQASSLVLPLILAAAHDVGHEGVHKTLHQLRADFHVPNARSVVQNYFRSCVMCQRNKGEH